VILEVNRKVVKDSTAFRAAVRGADKSQSLLLLVKRGDSTIFLALKRDKP
jgi:hypothetical protein